MRLPITCLGLLCAAQAATAAVAEGPDNTRVAGQALLGRAGWEPGVAAEIPVSPGDFPMLVRPEVFFNEDVRIGAGASALWSLRIDALPQRHMFLLGPRVAYHNADDWGWEGSAMAMYSLPLLGDSEHHHLEVIGTLGFMEDKRDDDSDLTLGGAGGVAYAWQF